jgi:hypothetical protein
LILAFGFLTRGNINGHPKTMQNLYVGACIVTGAFTLLRDRYLSHFVWTALGLLQCPLGSRNIIERSTGFDSL